MSALRRSTRRRKAVQRYNPSHYRGGNDNDDGSVPVPAFWERFFLGAYLKTRIASGQDLMEAIKHALEIRTSNVVKWKPEREQHDVGVPEIAKGDILVVVAPPFHHAMLSNGLFDRREHPYLLQFVVHCVGNGGCIDSAYEYIRPGDQVDEKETELQEMDVIQFIGHPNSERNRFLQVAAADLAEYLVSQHTFKYGGVCKLLTQTCFLKEIKAVRSGVEHYVHKLLTAEPQGTFVCSTFPLAIWQTVLYLFEPELLEKAMPLGTKGCFPKDLLTMAQQYPQYWKITRTPKRFRQYALRVDS